MYSVVVKQLLGTFLLVYGITCASRFSVPEYFPPCSLFLSLTLCHGGEFNAGLTFAITLLGNRNWVEALAKIIGQVGGAYLGWLAGCWIGPACGPLGQIGAIQLMGQFIGTLFFVLLISIITNHDVSLSKDDYFKFVAIPIGLLVGIYFSNKTAGLNVSVLLAKLIHGPHDLGLIALAGASLAGAVVGWFSGVRYGKKAIQWKQL